MLKSTDREKLQDCLLLVQSAQSILAGLKDRLVPDVEEIRRCFLDADRTLSSLLRS